MNEGQFIFI